MRIDIDITTGGNYETEVGGWLSDESISDADKEPIALSNDSLESSMTGISSIKNELETSLASLEADKVTITH